MLVVIEKRELILGKLTAVYARAMIMDEQIISLPKFSCAYVLNFRDRQWDRMEFAVRNTVDRISPVC